jgi:5,10-methylenetetrahydromethanopterin reductase
MKFGLNRFNFRTLEDFAEDVRMAEELGWDHCFTLDSQLALNDPYVMLTYAAHQTSRVGLGTLLTNPVTRHPTVTASSFATLDELSGGRALCVIGIGDTAVEHSGLRPATVRKLEEATVMMRALLAGEAVEVDWPEPARLRHARPVPVWIAAAGPKTLRMAGRSADGVLIRVGRHPANIGYAVEQVRAGIEESGRDPSGFSFGLIVHTVLVDEPDRALRIGRTMAAGYYDHTRALFERAGLSWDGPSPEELKQETIRPDFHHTYDLAAAGEHLTFLPSEAADSFVFWGGVDEVRGQMLETLRHDFGVEWEMVVPQPPGARYPHETSGPFYMERMAREVLPAVREALGVSSPV